MTDFWFSFLWTLLVTAATVLADWLSGRVMASTRGLYSIQMTVEQSIADESKISEIKAHLQSFQRKKALGFLWGVDLATVTLALDLTALGLWVSNKVTFPFFQRYNDLQVHREIGVWLIVLLVHFVILLFSVVFKHLHAERIENTMIGKVEHRPMILWLSRNYWLFAGNLVGFLSLLSGIVIATNAI